MSRTFHSFAELGVAFGITPKEQKPKTYFYRKCGGVLTRIDGTNVAVCRGKNGKACPGRYIIPGVV